MFCNVFSMFVCPIKLLSYCPILGFLSATARTEILFFKFRIFQHLTLLYLGVTGVIFFRLFLPVTSCIFQKQIQIINICATCLYVLILWKFITSFIVEISFFSAQNNIFRIIFIENEYVFTFSNKMLWCT